MSGGIEVEMLLEWGSKLTCFCVRAENDLVLLGFCVGGRNRLDFSVGD